MEEEKRNKGKGSESQKFPVRENENVVKVVEKIEMPVLLTNYLRKTVISYNGGAEESKETDDRGRKVTYKIWNIFKSYDEKKRHKHCSKNGKNFDLLVKYWNRNCGGANFVLTNFAIRAPYKCTAKIKSGIVFVWKEKPTISEYTKAFDFATEDKFNQEMKLRHSTKFKAFYFQTTKDQDLYHFETRFPDGIVGKYIHVKFIDSWGDPKVATNIDVERIGFVGYPNEEEFLKKKIPVTPYERVPKDWHLTRVPEDFYSSEWNFLEEFKKETVSLIEMGKFLEKWDINSFFNKKRVGLLHYAFWYKNTNRYDLVKFLLEYGKDKKKIDVNQVDRHSKKSVIHYAASCSTCDVKILELLVKRGCKLDVFTDLHENALHFAIYYCPKNLEVIQYLIEKGVSVNSKLGKNDLTPFHFSVRTSGISKKLIDIVVKSGGDFGSKSSDGNSVFHMMLMNSRITLDVVKLIVEKGLEAKLDINGKNNFGSTPAHLAAEHCNDIPIMEYLLSKKLNFDSRNKDGETPLHFSCGAGNLECCVFLLKNGADINAETVYGENCLHMASSKQEEGIFNFMILAGANYRKSDRYGNSPFSLFPKETRKSRPKWYDLATEKREEDFRLRLLLQQSMKGVPEKTLEGYFKNFVDHKVYYSDVLSLVESNLIGVFKKVIGDEGHRKLFSKKVKELSPYLRRIRRGREDVQLVKILLETRNEEYFHNFFLEKVHFSDLDQLLQPGCALDLKKLIPNETRRDAFMARVKDLFFSDAYTSGYFINPKKISTRGEVLGKGQFGVVESRSFVLTNKLSRTKSVVPVAIKQVPIQSMDNLQGTLKRDFLDEVELLLQIDDHPNVLKCFGCYFDDQQNPTSGSIVTELCEKGDLFNYLLDKENNISDQKTLDFYIQIAKGIYYMHTKKLVHGDLKSMNILRGKDGALKVADFGESRNVDVITSKKIDRMRGTAPYMCPELSDVGNWFPKGYDPKLIDVYAFGIVGWVLWARTQPYKEMKDIPVLELLKKIHQDGLRPNVKDMGKCSEDIRKFVQSCWEEDPKKRPQSFAEIVKILREIKKKDEKENKGCKDDLD